METHLDAMVRAAHALEPTPRREPLVVRLPRARERALRVGDLRTGLGALVSLLLLAALGCASFPGRQVPDRLSDVKSSAQRLPPVDYELSLNIFGKDSATLTPPPNVRENTGRYILPGWWLHKRIIKMYTSTFTEFRPGFGRAEIHLDMHFEYVSDAPKQAMLLSALVTVMTLGIIPGYERVDFHFQVRVVRSGEFVRLYTYHDYMRTWFGTFFLLFPSTTSPATVSTEVIDNMLAAFVADFHSDRALYAPDGD